MALHVDATTARSARELRVLPRRDVRVGFAVVLREFLDHDGTCGHVDTERERLGREDELEGPCLEAFLDDGLESGDLPCVVGGHTRHQRHAEVLVAQRVEILHAEPGRVLVGDLPEQAGLVRLREDDARVEDLADGGIASGAGEDEVDRGKKIRPIEHDRDLGTARRPTLLETRVRVAAEIASPLLASAGSPAGPTRIIPDSRRFVLCDAQQLMVHPRSAGGGRFHGRRSHAIEEIDQSPADEDMLEERDGATLADDRLEAPPDFLEPSAEVLDVAHRRGQRNELHRIRKREDDLFPDGAAEAIGEVVDFVHDHVSQARERRGVGVDHVAEHFGRHDNDLGVGVDR